MAVSIAGIDFSDRRIKTGSDLSVEIGDLTFIAQRKKYLFKNQDRYLSPYYETGFFSVNGWRGRRLVETDSDGRTVFDGTIQNISQEETSGVVEVEAEEPLVQFLDWPVNVMDKTTHVNFQVNGDVPKGNLVIPLKSGSTDIPQYAVMTFLNQISPEYMVYASVGSPTTSVSLDRPLDFDLTDGDSVTVQIPAIRTGPAAIKRALLTAGVPEDRLDGTFDALDAIDRAANRFIIMNIKETDNVTLRTHLQNLSELTDLVVIGKSSGRISIRRGIDYNGERAAATLTGAEILPRVRLENDKSKLFIGYDCLYRSDNDQVRNAAGDVSTELLNETAGVTFFQPIKVEQGLLRYRYLYNSAATADFFGQRALDYYGYVRINLFGGLKKTLHKRADRELNLEVGDTVILNYREYSNQPAVVLGYTFSERNLQYTKIKLQLNNYPAPRRAVA